MSTNEFKCEEKSSALVVTFPSVVSAELAEELEKQIKMWQLKNVTLHIFDFSNVLDFDRSLFKSIIQYKKNLEKVGKYLFSINMSRTLNRVFVDDGLISVFSPVSDLSQAYQKAGIKLEKKSGVKLDTNFVNPFILATIKTFQMQVNLAITPGKPYVKKEKQFLKGINLAGVINLTCKDFSGTIAIAFSEKTFLKIYETMLGEKLEKISDEAKDGAGELLNIIYGQAKTELNAKGFTLEKAIPTILSGENLDIHHASAVPSLVLPFNSDAGEFTLEISLSE